MNTIDLKRAEFRHYLEISGVMEALSYALIKLYDECDKPADPVAFVRKNFKRPDDDIIDTTKPIEDLNATELIEKQKQELERAREEIAKLRQTLDLMEKNSTNDTSKAEPKPQPTFQDIIDDPKFNSSIVKKILTEDLFNRLMEIENKPSFLECIKKVDVSDALGFVVVDAECYTTFGEFFEAIAKELNGIEELAAHPDSNWGDGNVFEKLDVASVVSIEISCRRTLANVPFIAGMSDQNLETVLANVQNAIQLTHTDDKEIDEEFFKITDINENEPIFEDLKRTELGFRSMNPFDHRLWPSGRGVYINTARTQSILINEEDHVRILSKEMNSDFGAVYQNLVALVTRLSDRLEFARHEKLGWLTTGPANVGTTLLCQVILKVNNPVEYLKEICGARNIDIESLESCGEQKCEENERFVRLKNQRNFACTEFECIKMFYDNLKEVIQAIDGNTEKQTDANDSGAMEANETVNEQENNNENEPSGACDAENGEKVDIPETNEPNESTTNEDNNNAEEDKENDETANIENAEEEKADEGATADNNDNNQQETENENAEQAIEQENANETEEPTAAANEE